MNLSNDFAADILSQGGYTRLKTLSIRLENCYGIEKLEKQFDFTECGAIAVYAPNGLMKSSFARTLDDFSRNDPPKDLVFPERVSVREIVDDKGNELPKDSVVVLEPYDGLMANEEQHSVLLLDKDLQEKYNTLYAEVNKAAVNLLQAISKKSRTRKDFKSEISLAIMQEEGKFYEAIRLLKLEMEDQKDAPFADIDYGVIFNDAVLTVLNNPVIRADIASYIARYNELLDKSVFCKKGVFEYYNASSIAKQLADHGFFDANHSVNLINGETRIIRTKQELEKLIKQEMDNISNDPALKESFEAIKTGIEKNAAVREFKDYVTQHEAILPELNNVAVFRRKVLKSYLREHYGLFETLHSKYEDARAGEKEIEVEASKQRTQWEEAVTIFNSRFIVPFTLNIANRLAVMTGTEPIPKLGFTFCDGRGTAVVDKPLLLKVLSMGEKKALYVLYIIFEVEARRLKNQETLFIVDDLADSFDYKNKYAVIEYLREITENTKFRQIILTHNFDFYRTIHSRFIRYPNCLMATKAAAGLELGKAEGIKNIFANPDGWKDHFHDDPRKRIGCIPFMRNLIEYLKGENDPDYKTLTALLHWKADTQGISQDDLTDIFNRLFNQNGGLPDATPVVQSIFDEGDKCLTAPDGINFENKIVLSIAIRLSAEKFMGSKLAPAGSATAHKSNQTYAMFKQFDSQFPGSHAVRVIKSVLLMTPENIHLNSFMYEPILDMSDQQLRNLYKEVKGLT